MTRNLAYPVAAIMLVCSLPACAGPATAQAETSPPPALTPTLSPTASSTPTLTPTGTPPPPTPDFLESPVAQGFLLSSSDDPNCQLPCWQGLRVGVSTREDIQAMFDNMLGFRGTLDFFAPSQIAKIADDPLRSIGLVFPGTQATGYYWQVAYKESNAVYEIDVIVDETTGILQGIYFRYYPRMVISEENMVVDPGYYTLHTSQQIIQTLGPPDYAFAEIAGGAVRLVLIYKRGIMSDATIIVPREQRVVSGREVTLGDFCLNAQSEILDEHLFVPFDNLDDEANLTPIQKEWVLDTLRGGYLAPVEQVLGVTIDDLVRISQRNEMPCIVINYSAPGG